VYQRQTSFYGALSHVATDLYQPIKLVVADAVDVDDVVDVLFDRELRV